MRMASSRIGGILVVSSTIGWLNWVGLDGEWQG